METLTTRGALFLGLLDGPAYGKALADRLKQRAPNLAGLGPGTVYPSLRALAEDGLVRSWTVTPRGRRGARSRIYYELTPRGVAVAQGHRSNLRSFLGERRPAHRSRATIERMRDRIRSCSEASAFLADLRRHVRTKSP